MTEQTDRCEEFDLHGAEFALEYSEPDDNGDFTVRLYLNDRLCFSRTINADERSPRSVPPREPRLAGWLTAKEAKELYGYDAPPGITHVNVYHWGSSLS